MASKGKIRAQISQQIKRLLAGGGAADLKFDYREIELAMDQNRDMLVKNMFFQQYAQGNFNIDQTYIHRFRNVPVALDADSGEYFSELPASLISLPNNREIYQVRPIKDLVNVYIPVNPNSIAINSSSKDIYLDGRKGYYRQGGNIYFVNLSSQDMVDKITMLLVSAGESVPDDEEYIGGDLEQALVNAVTVMFTPAMNKAQDTTDTDLIN
jgi:hypothetical protein